MEPQPTNPVPDRVQPAQPETIVMPATVSAPDPMTLSTPLVQPVVAPSYSPPLVEPDRKGIKVVVMVLLGILLLAGVGYGLYSIFGPKTQTNALGIKTTTQSVHKVTNSVSTKTVTNLTVDPSATAGYSTKGVKVTGNNSVLSYIPADILSGKISFVTYAWAMATGTSSNPAVASTNTAALKTQYPNASVTTIGIPAAKILGSDGQKYALSCNSTTVNLGTGPSSISYVTQCVAKFDGGQQNFSVSATSDSAANTNALVNKFIAGSTIHF
jgi:hypothetical protein